MIINFPTGLYRDVLPQQPQDKGSVTYIISNQNPPRTNLIYPKISNGIINRRRQIKEVQLTDRRQQLGDLVFSVSGARRQQAGNNSRQFEIGQLLEFDDSQFQVAKPMLVPPLTETRHDTNVFDYGAMGVSEDEQEVIRNASLKAQADLTARLNQLKRLRADAEVMVNTQQKTINEINRTLAGLDAILSITSDQDLKILVQKLKTKKDDAFHIRDQAIINANDYASEADKIVTELRAVAVVVK
jgi:uncharacterized coiled-coil protein SlyX